jgi:glycosyltransferase involved in cell wall biosynthesis
VHFIGHLNDDLSLRALYSASDAMVISSRQDNLPNTGLEAHACGTPVVAFNTGGLPDIVVHQSMGYLARTFEPQDLAAGISWVLADPQRRRVLADAARTRAEQLWNPARVSRLYQQVYQQAMECSK